MERTPGQPNRQFWNKMVSQMNDKMGRQKHVGLRSF